MGETFAAPVAGGFDAHQARILPVLHIADQHAVFDQRVLGAGGAFVIDGDRTAPVGNRAVVKHGHAFGCDLLAHQARKGRRLLAVEIAFQPVADGFVQQNAGPAGAEGDVHDARRGGHGFKIDQGDAKGLVYQTLPMRRAGSGRSGRAARRRPRRRFRGGRFLRR